MKIKHIYIQNLASLKGEHQIDFEDIEKQSSLFAITGETGSGKSTLLSAISLAIYGKNYKKSIIQNDLVTLGTSEGKASVTYQIRNKTYQSVWFCRLKKKNGEDLKNPKPHRELFEILESGEKILLEKSEEEILGLSFDQFCKTVILNQGEFSRFLLASFSERKEILERFYNAEALSRLGKIAKRELDEIQSSINENLSKIAGISSHQTEDPKKLKEKIEIGQKEIAQKKEIQKDYEHLIKSIHEILLNLETKDKNIGRLDNVQKTLREITQKHNEYLIRFNHIKEEFFQSKAVFEKESPKLQKAIEIDKECRFYENQITEEKNHLSKNSLALKELKKEEEKLKKDLENLSIERVSKFLKSDSSLLEIENDLDEIRILKSLKQDENYLRQNHIKLLQILKESETEGKIQGHELNELISFLDKNKTLDELSIELKSLELKLELAIEYEKKKKDIDDLIQKNKSKRSEINELLITKDKETKKLQTLIFDKEKTLERINDSLELVDLKKSIHLCLTASLKDGVCLVCNSNIKEKKLASTQDKDSLKVDTLLSDKKRTTHDLEKSKESFQKITAETTQLNKNLKELIESEEKDVESFMSYFKDKLPLSKDEIRKEQEALKSKQLEIQNKNIEKSKLDQNLKTLRERYKKTKLEEEDLNKKLFDILNKLKTHKERIVSLSHPIELNDLFPVENEMSRVIKNLQISSENEYKIKNLVKRIIDLDQSVQSSIEKEGKLQEKTKELRQSREILTKENSPNKLLEELSMDIKEKEKEFEKSQNILKRLEIELKENEAIKRQTTEQINDINIMLELKLSELSLNLKNKKESTDEILNDLAKKMDIKSLPEEVDLTILKVTHEKLSSTLFEIKDQLESLQMIVSKNQTLLDEFHKASQRKELIELEMEKQKEDYKRKEILFSLVGRDEFRNFVLSQIEKELIYQTNKELIRLCDGRYEIIQENKTSRILPEFFIIDKLRDGGTRKVSTLSGGETFMVSLACALALAELSRGTAEIDSFFIDEGFGTLDEDSLEDVIEMLQSIQGLGKQIGVISHVKKLTERIPINIHLDKNHFGDSRITFLLN